MYMLAQDFQNSDIIGMLRDFFENLPDFLWWLIQVTASNLFWLIPTVLAIFTLVFLKLYLDVLKERRAAIRELSALGMDIKTTALKSLFNKTDKPDILFVSPKGKKFAVKFFPNTQKRINICIFDAENAVVSKNNISINGNDIIKLGGENNAEEIAKKTANDVRAKAVRFPIDTASADYEKIFLFSPSASKITYVKPSGDVAEVRDGDAVFGVRLATKGTLVRFFEEKAK